MASAGSYLCKGSDGLDAATSTKLAASKPTAAQCAAFLGVGPSIDRDGDRLFERIEYRGYNTIRLLLDTMETRTPSP